MDEAERCDRLLLMRDGGLIADDAPGALRARTGDARPRGGVPEDHRGGGMSAASRSPPPAACWQQLRGDPRTIALLLFVPCLLMTLLHWVFADQPETFDRVGLQLLGIFPFVTMFLVTSVAMLRERTSGTLERLLTTPLAKLDLLLGYALAFGIAALAPGHARERARARRARARPGRLGRARAPARGRRRRARHGARAVRQRVRAERVPGRPVPARVRAPADAAVRPDRAARRDGGRARSIGNAPPMTYAVDAMSELTAGTDLLVVALCAAAALALGAATLRRRSA